jgi:hypothetical protein
VIKKGDPVIVLMQRKGEDPRARQGVYVGESFTQEEHVRVAFPDSDFFHTFHATQVFTNTVDVLAALAGLE